MLAKFPDWSDDIAKPNPPSFQDPLEVINTFCKVKTSLFHIHIQRNTSNKKVTIYVIVFKPQNQFYVKFHHKYKANQSTIILQWNAEKSYIKYKATESSKQEDKNLNKSSGKDTYNAWFLKLSFYP